MATPEQIVIVRQLLPSGAAAEGWDDTYIGTMIDALFTTSNILWQYWEGAAARMSKMVDTAESGSSRKMSDLFDNALAMAKYWKGKVDQEELPPVTPTTFSGTRPIRRV
jgi:hypothetical protein